MKHIFFIIMFFYLTQSYASGIQVGESCVLDTPSDTCSTTISMTNNNGTKVCLWRAATNGNPLTIFACYAATTATGSKVWTQTSLNVDDFELMAHDNWPTHDEAGYLTGTLLDSKPVVAEYGKMTVPSPCSVNAPEDTCSTTIDIDKRGAKISCVWMIEPSNPPLVFGCKSSGPWNRNWTQTSVDGNTIELRAHDDWPANDPQAYQNSLLLDTIVVSAELQQPSVSPVISSTTISCANKYCMTIRGTDFDANASVRVRENISGSTVTVFAGNDIYSRSFSETEDKIFFPIQSISLQNKWDSNGLCFTVSNNGVLSNEQCIVRNYSITQPLLMGEVVQGYPGQDVEYTSFIVKGDASPLEGGNLLKIMGNSWKKIYYSYNVTPDTVLEFDFKSNQQEAEINGIGFILSGETTLRTTTHMWQVYGTQAYGHQEYHDYSGTDYKSYSIPIGQYFTGQITSMVFLADEDVHVGQNTIFQNPRLVEDIPDGSILGNLDSVNDDFITGWACESGNAGNPLQIKIYSTHAFSDDCMIVDGKQICLIATGSSQGSLAQNCGVVNENTFSIPTPSVVKNGGSHDIYAIASSTLLSGVETYKFYSSGYSPYWDSGLSQKCVKRALGNPESSFEDLSGCTDPDNHYYTIALQAEHTYGERCEVPGDPYGASISGYGQDAFQFYWTEDSKGGLTANMDTDIDNFTHSCGIDGDNVWNWYVFGLRSSESGVHFPDADKSAAHFTLKADYGLLEQNANTRIFAICEGWWNGSAKNVVINFVRTNPTDLVPDDPEVVTVYSQQGNNEYSHINYLGEELGFEPLGINEEKDYFINCGSLFKHSVDRGYLPEPVDGWENTGLSKVFIGHEFHNISNQNSGYTHLELKNYRIAEISEN